MARNLFKLGALEAKRTAFLMCDMQESFRPTIKHFGEVVKISNKMIESAKYLNIPVYASEHNAEVNGPTTKDIDLQSAALVYDKFTFSMYTEELRARLRQDVPDLQTVVIFGVAVHLCMEVSIIDLLHDNLNVHVIADGVSSRTLMDRKLALQRLQAMGCFIGTSENVLFKILGHNHHPQLRKVTRLYVEPIPDVFGDAR